MIWAYANMTVDIDIPSCPKTVTSFSFPSTSVIFVIYTITSFIFAIIIAFKYNSVKVFNRKIRTQNISNTMWILFYLTLTFRAVCNTIRYATYKTLHASPENWVLYLAAFIIHGISAFTLSLALNHQRKYRSSSPQLPATPSSQRETEPLIGSRTSIWLRRSVTLPEILFFFFFLVYLLCLYLVLIFPPPLDKNNVYTYLFVVSFILQRLPVVVLVMMIVFHRNNNDGPTKKSKALLFIGALLNISNDLPIATWSSVLRYDCIFKFASGVDLMLVINLVSLLFFFLFLRSEYIRNREECIWTTVSQIQDTFDFRKF
eukprot:TRINITY_DN1068_c0_g1_i2.p1 TRINITY_DN1068_c0_g1~~TRINITY_DN1068_c0_g1_i2.p1  ORF type:complete len:316 (-),score=34.49 TRINITY_DN1068_c0_g1_i2:94-1041(-)